MSLFFFYQNMSDISANNKRIAKNTVFLYFRSLFILLVSLYTSRIILQILGVEDYGIYQVVGGVVAMFSMLSNTLASASQRFITFALGKQDVQGLRNVFSTSITLHIILGFIVVVLLEIAGVWFLNNKINMPQNRLSAAEWVMHFSIATFFIGVISVPYNAVIIAHEKMSAFAYISIFESLLKLGSVFLLMSISFDKLLLYAILQFAIAIVIRGIYTVYSSRHFEETNNLTFRISKALFKEMFAFAGWNLFGNGSLVLRNQGVDIVLNTFFGVVVNASKGISNQVNQAVFQLVDNFTTAIKPQMTKAIAQGDYQRAFTLVNNGSRYIFLLMLFFTIPIIVCAPQLLGLWLGTVPDYSVEFVQWTMLYLLLDSLSRLLIHAILSNGDIKIYQIVVGGTKLLSVPFVLLFLLLDLNPLWGIWVNILVEIVCLLERIYYNKKLLKFDYIRFVKDVILRCTFLLVVAFVLSTLFSVYISDNLIVSVVVSVSVTLSIIWLLGTNARERGLILQFINNKISRQ